MRITCYKAWCAKRVDLFSLGSSLRMLDRNIYTKTAYNLLTFVCQAFYK